VKVPTKADPEKIREIQERGFTLIPSVIPWEEVGVLRALLQTCVNEDLDRWKGKPYPDSWMVHNLMVRGMPFARLMESECLQAYLCALLSDTCIIYAYTSSSMPPKGTNFSHRIHHDCPRFIPGYVTNVGVMLALDDYTEENGATYFLPGSHLQGDTPSEQDFMAKAERVFPKQGEAVIFNARTFHIGGRNETDQPRHAVTMNVCRAYMRQRFDYPRLVPKEVVEQLGDVGRRFLGFNVRVPTSLEEYYVPEDQRLYKAGQG
jgi:ectoine hydroxylase-related dioxygenase (phytanoyl-CoA dioxygenase family)